ncbi:MAG TPA: hypothetical protein VHB21_14870, partial [Minicystis sp.]|nr:hypothetical protein [Minicystis sp.]
MLEHAGLTHLRAEIAVVRPDGQAQTASCSSGACGGMGKIDVRASRVQQTPDGAYVVSVPAGEIGHPVVLTTGLVRAVSFMFLNELDAYAEVPAPDREPLTDLAATMLGFGLLLANGAYVYIKGCSGAQVHRATRMSVEELAIALGIFCELYAAPVKEASRCLEPTPREAFDEALAWTRSNASVVRMLRGNRRAIEADAYRLAPARSWLARAFGAGKKRRAPDEDVDDLERALLEAAPAASERRIDPNKQARLAEIRALVDDALDG